MEASPGVASPLDCVRTEPAPRMMTDLGNAERLADHAKDKLLYVHGLGWLYWDGRRWASADETGRHIRVAKDTVRGIYGEARALHGVAGHAHDEEDRKSMSTEADQLSKHARSSESAVRINAMLKLGESEPRLRAVVADLDADPDALNVQNGILDLGTLELGPHDPAARLTRIAGAAYTANATAPGWESFLERILPDAELRNYVQRAAGYSLLGQYSEYLFLPLGYGANGKSTFLGVLREVLGDYAAEAAPELLVARQQADNPALASLRGCRLVTTIESEQGKKLAEVLVKQLTGEAEITARFLYRDYFTFENQSAVWFATNHKPYVQGSDYAIWRRIRLISFDVTIPEDEREDPANLRRKLLAERDGILAWAVNGLRAVRDSNALETPARVTAETEAYRQEMDPIGEWIEDCCELRHGAFTSAAELRQSYEHHCYSTGRAVLGATRFGDALKERGIMPDRPSINGKQVRGRIGIAVRPPASPSA
jgi:putative DNA primase/helicase